MIPSKRKPIPGTSVEILNIPRKTPGAKAVSSLYPIRESRSPVTPADAACPSFLAKE